MYNGVKIEHNTTEILIANFNILKYETSYANFLCGFRRILLFL